MFPVGNFFVVCQAFLPLLKKAAVEQPGEKMSWSKAAVINMSSLLGSIAYTGAHTGGGRYAYRASKVGLQGKLWHAAVQAGLAQYSNFKRLGAAPKLRVLHTDQSLLLLC